MVCCKFANSFNHCTAPHTVRHFLPCTCDVGHSPIYRDTISQKSIPLCILMCTLQLVNISSNLPIHLYTYWSVLTCRVHTTYHSVSSDSSNTVHNGVYIHLTCALPSTGNNAFLTIQPKLVFISKVCGSRWLRRHSLPAITVLKVPVKFVSSFWKRAGLENKLWY